MTTRTDAVLVAAVQLDTRDDPDASFAEVRRLVGLAAARGARVVALPENCLDESLERGRVQPPDLWGPKFSALAREHRVALVAGTVREPADGDARPYQTALAFAPDGREVFRYRKVHLFDVQVTDGPRERESDGLRPGPTEGVGPFDLEPLGKVGVGICYDLRFPELWRRLARGGARVLFVPSSFALGTGKDHWHVLLRARAIEDQCWVVAPAQIGTKPGGRPRYGHALIVDPWGCVVADAGADGPGLALGEVDLARADRIRRELPSLANARLPS